MGTANQIEQELMNYISDHKIRNTHSHHLPEQAMVDFDLDKLTGTSDMKKVKDMRGNPLLLFVNEWSVGMTVDRNKGLILTEFGRN